MPTNVFDEQVAWIGTAFLIFIALMFILILAVHFLKKALRPSIESYQKDKTRREKEYQEYREGYKREHGYYPPEEKSSNGNDFATGFIIGSLWH